MSVRDDVRTPVRPAPGPTRPPAATPPRRRTRGGGRLPPPWSRAPLLPFGQPAVILAVLVAAAILGCAGSSAPLFLSSASSESMARLMAAACPEASSVALRATAPARAEPTLSLAAVPALTGVGMVPPVLTMVGPTPYQLGGRVDGGPNPVLPVYRTEALRQVTPVARAAPGVRGVWLTEAAAGRIAARPGDTVQLTVQRENSLEFRTVDVRVAGVYRNLFQEPLRPYWCNFQDLIYDPVGPSGDDPPSFALATDSGVFADVVGTNRAAMTWESRVDTAGMTLTRSRDLADRQSAAYRAAGLPEPVDFGRRNGGAGQQPELGDRAALIRAGLRGPVLPIALGGTLLALLLLGAAG